MKFCINHISFTKINQVFNLLLYVFQGHQDMWTNLLTIWWKMSRMGNASGLTTCSKVSRLYICPRLGFFCCVIQISHPEVPAAEVFVSCVALFMAFCRQIGWTCSKLVIDCCWLARLEMLLWAWGRIKVVRRVEIPQAARCCNNSKQSWGAFHAQEHVRSWLGGLDVWRIRHDDTWDVCHPAG